MDQGRRTRVLQKLAGVRQFLDQASDRVYNFVNPGAGVRQAVENAKQTYSEGGTDYQRQQNADQPVIPVGNAFQRLSAAVRGGSDLRDALVPDLMGALPGERGPSNPILRFEDRSFVNSRADADQRRADAASRDNMAAVLQDLRQRYSPSDLTKVDPGWVPPYFPYSSLESQMKTPSRRTFDVAETMRSETTSPLFNMSTPRKWGYPTPYNDRYGAQHTDNWDPGEVNPPATPVNKENGAVSSQVAAWERGYPVPQPARRVAERVSMLDFPAEQTSNPDLFPSRAKPLR